MASAALAPSAAVYDSWTTIKEVLKWAGVLEERWRRVAAELGDPELENLFVLAGMEGEDWGFHATRGATEIWTDHDHSCLCELLPRRSC